MKYEQHPLSAAFPAMSADDYQTLKDSINEIGVQNPITLFEGMVIDGWHRYSAANDLGMECPVVELGDVDPVDYVKAQNKARRHLPLGAWALIEVSLHQWKPVGANQHTGSALSAEAPKSTKELAQAAGVGVRSIEQAKTVQAKAAPEVVEAVKAGKIGLPKAAAIAKLPKEQQAEAIKKPIEKPAKPLPEDKAYAGPSEEEIRFHQEQEAADQKAIALILDSNEPLAALKAEYERQSLELATVKAARDGYMTKCNELIRRVKSLRSKLDKLEREHGKPV